MQTTKPPNHQTTKLLALLPYVLIFVVIFMMNFWQLPVADEWAQFRGNKGVEILMESIAHTYMNWNARIGEIIFKFFMTMVSDDIFVMQKIFGVVNTFVFMILLFNVFFIVVGRYPDFKDTRDSVMFLFTFMFMHFSSDFNASFIWQSGAVNYGWVICLYSCFAVPYRRFFDYTFKSKKEITIFNLALQYEEGYFSLREIIKGLLFLLVSIPIGMGAETTTPVILIGLAIYTLYLVFIKKTIPPLWFFMGGVGLFVGWLLLYFAPGPRKRNAITSHYIPIHEQSLVTIIKRFIKHNFRSYVYLNWIIMGVLLILNKKNIKSMKNIFPLILVALFFCGAGVVSLLAGIPERTYITITIFLAIANLILLSLVIQKYTKQFFIVGMLIVVGLSSFELVEYYRFNTLLNGYFSYIVEQRDAGIEDVKIYTKKRKDFILKTPYLYTVHSWVQKPMARFFGVGSIEFFDKDTGESYRIEGW